MKAVCSRVLDSMPCQLLVSNNLFYLAICREKVFSIIVGVNFTNSLSQDNHLCKHSCLTI